MRIAITIDHFNYGTYVMIFVAHIPVRLVSVQSVIETDMGCPAKLYLNAGALIVTDLSGAMVLVPRIAHPSWNENSLPVYERTSPVSWSVITMFMDLNVPRLGFLNSIFDQNSPEHFPCPRYSASKFAPCSPATGCSGKENGFPVMMAYLADSQQYGVPKLGLRTYQY